MYNSHKTFSIFVAQVERLIQEKGWEFMWNENLGYILTCPSNLGTGLRAGVHVNLPRLSKVLALEIHYYLSFLFSPCHVIILHLVGPMHGNINAFSEFMYVCYLSMYFNTVFLGVRVTHIYVISCLLCIKIKS